MDMLWKSLPMLHINTLARSQPQLNPPTPARKISRSSPAKTPKTNRNPLANKFSSKRQFRFPRDSTKNKVQIKKTRVDQTSPIVATKQRRRKIYYFWRNSMLPLSRLDMHMFPWIIGAYQMTRPRLIRNRIRLSLSLELR